MVTAVIVLMFLVEPIPQMVNVEANPYNFVSSYLSIESPSTDKSEIYQTTRIPIEVRVRPARDTTLVEISYILDGGRNTKLRIIGYENTLTYTGKGTLENLTNGYHTVKALSIDSKGNVLLDSRIFLVNTTFRYPTFLLTPPNITYYSDEVPLTYSVPEQLGVEYLLDNSGYKTIQGNTTLEGLSEGQHTLTVTAFSADNGIYSKQTANFTIDKTNPSPLPTQTIPEFPTTFAMVFPLIFSLAATVLFRRMTGHESQRKALLPA